MVMVVVVVVVMVVVVVVLIIVVAPGAGAGAPELGGLAGAGPVAPPGPGPGGCVVFWFMFACAGGSSVKGCAQIRNLCLRGRVWYQRVWLMVRMKISMTPRKTRFYINDYI
jgi:hypothetical protein